jgi:KaiC/GvpD/RAD55 family RecA-like ATPase
MSEGSMYLNIRQGLQSKPTLVPADSDIEKLIKNPNNDHYISLYLYNEAHKKLLEEKGTLAGIRDNVTNRLFFDFDCEEDLEKARADTLTAATRLVEQGFPEDSIGVYFTGMKGFNIEIQLNQLITPKQFTAAIFNIAGDLLTFDKVVRDSQRIVRIVGTKHQDTGLFKIPLTPEELCDLSIDEIKKKASRRRIIETIPAKADIPQELLVQKEEEITAERIAQELSFDISSIDMKNRPKGMDEARWLLANGFFKVGEGERHLAMLCLAATYKNQGYNQTLCDALLKGVAIVQADRTGEEEFSEEKITAVTNQVFSDSWQGGQFTTRDPSNWLAKYAKKMGLDVKKMDKGPMLISDVEAEFTDFCKNYEQNVVLTGVPFIDQKMPLTLGTNGAIVGAPGSGKTTLALNILKNCSAKNMTTVFFSLDMHRKRMFEKIMYDVTELNRDQLYEAFRSGKGKELTAKMKEMYGSVWFYDKSGTSPEDMANYVKQVEEYTDTKVKLVMIDYLERVQSDKSSDTEASKDVAKKVQDLVMDLDIVCITLVQPSKAAYAAGPDQPIENMTAIKGSSYLQQSYRNIISLWRPGYNPDLSENGYDKFIEFAILKNDLGSLGKTVMGFDGAKGRIRPLEDHEYKEHKMLLEMKKEAKEEDKGSSGWD